MYTKILFRSYWIQQWRTATYTLIKMSPPSLSKFDVEDGVKLVAIVAMSDFTKDYLIKQKIIPYNI